MSGFRPVDHGVREDVVSCVHETLLVEAGAGTGKTTLLTDKYVHLVMEKKVPPERIVAITFTDKAAGELRDRIHRALLTKGLANEARRLERANISTIHAFASSLLRERPMEAGLDPSFQSMDAIEADLFLQRSYSLWLHEAIQTSPGPLRRMLFHGGSLYSIRKLAFELYRYRDLLHKLESRGDSPSAREIFLSLRQKLLSWFASAETECKNKSDHLYQWLYEEVSGLPDKEADPYDLEAWILERTIAASKGNQGNWNSAFLKKLKETLAEEKATLTKIQNQIRREVAVDLFHWLKGFSDYVSRKKQEEGLVDFDDLLIHLRDLLQTRPDVLEDFQRRVQFIFVDEYQDTDPIQTAIVWLLSSQIEDKPWHDRSLVPGRLFVVGDPKQSIYRFRRADIRTYRFAHQNILSSGRVLAISQNFRSREGVLGWINEVFRGLFKEEYEDLRPVPMQLATMNGPSVHILDLKDPPRSDLSKDLRAFEGAAIAAYIHRLIEDGELQIRDPKDSALRKIEPHDIAVLFPGTTDMDVFEEALRKQGVPFSVDGGKLFYKRSEVHGALCLLRAIAFPRDSIAVVSALRSVFLGCSDQDLFEFHSLSQDFDYRKPFSSISSEALRTALDILRDLHENYSKDSPSTVLAHCFERCLALPLSLMRFHGEEAASNLDYLLYLARAFENSGSRTLPEFLQWMEARDEEGERFADENSSFSHQNRVRLMTVHKAKGLEFPVVVVANLGSIHKQLENVLADRLENRIEIGFGSREARFCTSGFEELWEREKEEFEEESKRLLYVAVTRARDFLILPKVPLRRKGGGFWKFIDEVASRFDSATLVTDLNLSENLKSEPLEIFAPPLLDIDSEKSSFLMLYQKRGTSWQRGLPLFHPSEEKDGEILSRLTGRNQGAEIGSLVHLLLEKTFRNRRPLSEDELLFLLAQEGAGASFLEVQPMLDYAYSSEVFQRALGSSRGFAEFPFAFETDDFRGEKVLWEGIVDLVFEEGSGLVLVDYKTDTLPASQIDSRAKLYRPQMLAYASALETLLRRPVLEMHLLFLRSQVDDLVQR